MPFALAATRPSPILALCPLHSLRATTKERDVVHRMRGLRAAQLSVMVACLLCMVHSPVMADDGRDPLVLALYYAWYDWAAWSQPTCDLPATLYVSADESAVERHVREARSAGIDALVQAWYGPTLGANLTEPNLHTLLDEAAGQGVKVAILADMTGTYLRTPADVSEALVAVRDQHAAAQCLPGR